MRIYLLLPILLTFTVSLRGNGLEDTSFYVLPLKEFTLDRDALAHYAPGGSAHKRVIEGRPDFELHWSESAIGITFIKNDPAELRKDYGKFLELAPPNLRPQLEQAFDCKSRLKITVERGMQATIVHSARQVLLCDKLGQLGGGFILTSGGLYFMNGEPISKDQPPRPNIFFPPPKL